MDELKPCPFCGRKPSKVREHYIAGLGVIYYTVECKQKGSKCFVNPKTTYLKSEKEAIEAWNRRADNG